MSEFGGPADPCPNDHSHGDVGCAEVIAEVWTLLDGECTSETRERLRQHLDYGSASGWKFSGPPSSGVCGSATASGIGPLAVVGFAVLSVALLTATLGHLQTSV
jgi:hypothetical protein